MLYYESIYKEDESRKITLEEFKAIFTDWDGTLMFLSPEEFKQEFDSLHCTIDPFHEEINCKTVPIVERSYEDLKDEYDESCWEI